MADERIAGGYVELNLRDANLQGDIKKSLSQVDQQVKSSSKEISNTFKTGMAVAGLAAGAAMALEFTKALDIEKANDKLAAQLGSSAKQSKELGEISGKLYAEAYGENIGEVNNALRTVIQSGAVAANASKEEIKAVSGAVLDLSTAMEQDVGQTSRAIGQLIKNGLAKDGKEALDILTVGFQKTGDPADDLLDTVSEYSTKFRDLGLTGAQAMGLLSQGLQAGARDTDYIADALKEFSIRAIDGTELTASGFQKLGLRADEMAKTFAQGGPAAAGALDVVLDRLRAMTDPVERDAAAVALFGTKAEDLGDALFALDVSKAMESIGNVAGASEAMGKTLNDNAQTNLTAFKRSMELNVTNFLGNQVIPVVSSVGSAVGSFIGPIIKFFTDLPGPVQAAALALGIWHIAGSRIIGTAGGMLSPLKGLGDQMKLQQTLAAQSGESIGKFRAAIGTLESNVPVIGNVGMAFRNARGDIEGFGGVARGVGAAAFSTLKGAASGLMGVLGGPWGLAITAGVTLLGVFGAKSQEAAAKQAQMAAAGKTVADAIKEQNGVMNEAVRTAAAKQAADKGLFDLGSKLGISSRQITDALLSEGAARDDLVTKLRGMELLRNGEMTDAARLLGGLGSLNGEIFKGVEANKQIAAAVGSANTAFSTVGGTIVGTTPPVSTLDQKMLSLKLKFDEGTTTVEKFKLMIDSLNQTEMNSINTQEAYEASIDALTESVKTNGASLDIHTAKGRANRDVLEDTATKIRDMVKADLETFGPSEQVIKNYDARILALQNQAKGLGLNKEQTQLLINKFGEVPRDITALMKLVGYQDVTNKLQEVSSIQDRLARGIPIPAGSVGRLAAGGLVTGPGSTTGDKIPAMLSNREFVQRAAAVKYYGINTMAALNHMRIPREQITPGLANGGMLTIPMPTDVSKTEIPDWATGVVGGMQKFALAQQGKRYLWGGVGPGAYDCSGLVGNLWALATGNPLYRRYMTTASMGAGAYGMKPGPGVFTIYLGPGHTAANIGGLHVEAYGGNGTPLAIGRVGTPLSYYTQRMHLFAEGGLADIRDNPLKRLASFTQRGWPEPPRTGEVIRQMGGFDYGGSVVPGWNAIYNGTGRPENVRSAAQEDTLALKLDRIISLLQESTGDVHVYLGDQELNVLVREVISDRNRAVKRAAVSGGRRAI